MRKRSTASGVAAPLLAVGSMVCLQAGSALSLPLLVAIGPSATTWLRLVGAAAIMWMLSGPVPAGHRGRAQTTAVLLGVATGGMAVFFSEAIARIPLGVATAIEFVGPLAVAVTTSRKLLDLCWASLAGAGVFLMVQTRSSWSDDSLGMYFAAAAAVCWAAYIVLTKRVGQEFQGFHGLAISLTAAAVVAAPIGIEQLSASATPLDIVAAVALGFLMPVLPFSLEMLALRRMSTRAFGILMSADPAISVLVGWITLHQYVDALEALGIACVVVASFGITTVGRSGKSAS